MLLYSKVYVIIDTTERSQCVVVRSDDCMN